MPPGGGDTAIYPGGPASVPTIQPEPGRSLIPSAQGNGYASTRADAIASAEAIAEEKAAST